MSGIVKNMHSTGTRNHFYSCILAHIKAILDKKYFLRPNSKTRLKKQGKIWLSHYSDLAPNEGGVQTKHYLDSRPVTFKRNVLHKKHIFSISNKPNKRDELIIPVPILPLSKRLLYKISAINSAHLFTKTPKPTGSRKCFSTIFWY